MFHRESPDEESAKKDPEDPGCANTSDSQPSPEGADILQPRPNLKLTTWKMTVRRLSEMERYRAAGRRDDISTRSRAAALGRAALRKTEVGLLQSVEEVWFAGCHSDVGGQYPTLYHQLLPLILVLKVEWSKITADTLSPISPSDGWSSRSCSPNAVSFLITSLSGGPILISQLSSSRTLASPPSENFGKRGPRSPNLHPWPLFTKVAITLAEAELQKCGRLIRTC